MAINTLNTLKDALTAFAVGHGQLQGRIIFEADDHRSAYITEENTYPLMFVAPIDVNVGRALNTHTLRVYVYERINDDRLDVWENANDTSLLLRDIRVWWNDYGTDDILIIEDPVGQFGSDKELDNLVGYYANIRFEIPSHGRCQVPVTVTPVTPGTCLEATAVLKNTTGATISTTPIASGASEDITAPDATYLVQYANGTLIQSGNIASGESVIVNVPNVIVCAVANWELRDSLGVLLQSGTVTSGGTVVITAPNTTVNVNAVLKGSVVAGSTLEVNTNIAPTSSTLVGNVLDLQFPASAPAISTATLMKTGQTTSYRTGDDGDIEAGRGASFFVLAENNPFGNTNRFTDELGGQTYTNNIVIDWSTYNGSNVLGYFRNITTIASSTFPVVLNNINSLSVAGFSNWRMANSKENFNILKEFEPTGVFNYSPFNIFVNYLWSNGSQNTTSAMLFSLNVGGQIMTYTPNSVTGSAFGTPVRTFTVTGTTLS